MLLGSKVICVRIYLYRTFTFCGSPFPHGTMRYRLVRVFSLMRYGPHRFTQNSSCSMLLGSRVICVRIYLYRTFTFYGLPFQTIPIHQYTILNILQFFTTLSLNPLNTTAVSLTYLRFRLDPFRSPLLWVSFLLSFPRVT